MCKTFQTSVREMSERYYSQLRRHNYVTPTSYLELILTFKTLLNIKRNEVDTARNRYIVGLQKLEFATSQVMQTPQPDESKPFCFVFYQMSLTPPHNLFSAGVSHAGGADGAAAGAHPDISRN